MTSLIAGIILLLILIGLVILLARIIWGALTTDWFGIYYDDPTSPYYHDKQGKGRGHDR